MSGQAKRSRVRATILHREQVARLIALATIPGVEDPHCSMCGGTGEDDEREIVNPRAHHVSVGPNLLAQMREHAATNVTVRAAPTVATLLPDGRIGVSYDDPSPPRMVLSPEAVRGLYEQRPINANYVSVVDRPRDGSTGSLVAVHESQRWETVRIDPAHILGLSEPISIGYTAEMREPDPCRLCGGSGRGLDVAVRATLDGGRFDVSMARAYGEQLVREGTAALETWVVYMDWLRSQGWEDAPWPPRALIRWRPDPPTFSYAEDLAHRRAWAESGHVRVECTFCDGGTSPVWDSTGRDVPCPRCRDRGWLPGKRPRMDGAALVRLGSRLLAALEGQPSECQACRGRGKRMHRTPTVAMMGPTAPHFGPCEDCRGTGHNLAGVLAPIDWPMPVLRHACDVDVHHRPGQRESWIETVIDATGLADPSLHFDTRSVPRGEHRRVTSFCRPALMWTLGEDPKDWPTLDERITARGLSYAIPHDRLPRWRRGEFGQGVAAWEAGQALAT